jgi:hypothetical protein
MDGKGSALISDASLEHLRKRIASFKSQDDLRRWWMECIGKHAARDPRVIALKDAAKERLNK